MKRYLDDYIKKCERLIEDDDIDKDTVRDLYRKISFFQHERLIHLLVTMCTFIFAVLFVIMSFNSIKFIIPSAILLVLGIFYIIHYYHLENGVQYLYVLYDEMNKKL